jgi:hypothetical protein
MGNVTNSAGPTAGHDGIRIASANSVDGNDNAVSGHIAADNQPVKTRNYGLTLTSALGKRTVVGPGNDFAGYRTGTIRNLGTGTVFASSVA